MRKIKIYLIARISPDAHAWNEKVCSYLNSPIDVFMPHKHNPWDIKHRIMPFKIVKEDLRAIRAAHIGLALPEFGNDCSYEVGYFSHSDKPVVIFIDDQLKWLNTWMVKGGITHVITTNEKTYKTLKKDQILKYKEVIHIRDLEELTATMQDIYRSHYKK